ncbi:MAG: rhodanese-like domain-containing protein [bacterium]
MKKIYVLIVVMAMAVVTAGCWSTGRCCGHCGDRSPACATMKKAACPTCNMSKGQCKCGAMAKPMAEINTSALKALIDTGAALTLVDARTGKFDDGRRISNAVNLGPDAKDDEIQSMLKSKDALIVSYCVNTKCPASVKLAAKLTAMGYTRVLEYPQGIEGWVGEGNPVTQVAK